MDLKQKVNPVVAVIIAIVVLVGIGFLSMKLIGNGSGSDKQVVVPKPDMNDPKFKQDPKLGGGNR
jgi:hypothetical protein